MKKSILYLLCILVVISCSKFDDSQLISDIKSIDNRISTLEMLLKAQSGKLTVSSVEEKNGMQVVVFSDGSSIRVTNGKDGLPGKDGKDGEPGKDGADGLPGKDGKDAQPGSTEGIYVSSFYVLEGIATFVMSNGKKVLIPMESTVSDISIDISIPENLYAAPGVILDIPFTIASYKDSKLQAEIVASPDLDAKIVWTDDFSGIIKTTIGQSITEYSKIVLLISNGYRMTMKSVSFAGHNIKVAGADCYEVSSAGGSVDIVFMADKDYVVEISNEGKSWINCIETKAMERREKQLDIQQNFGEERSALVTVRSKKGGEELQYRIVQSGVNIVNVPAGVFGPMPFKIIVENADFVEGYGPDKIISRNRDECFRITNKVTLIKITSDIPFTVQDFKFKLASMPPSVPYNHNMTYFTSCNGQRYNFFLKVTHTYSYAYSYDERYFHPFEHYNIEGFVRGIMLEIDLTPDCGDFIDLSDLGFVATPCNMDFRTMEDLDVLGHKHKYSPVTPMGKAYENAIEPSEEELAKLSDPSFEPNMFIPRHSWQQKDVVLYPNGVPMPDDVNQHSIGDCAALSIFADFAYLYPGFIKSIIKDNKDNSYTVSMYDPKGKRVSVTVSDKFIVDENGEIGMCTSKDGSAGWATILEKAMMKWEDVYKVRRSVEGIDNFEAAPLFTGNGTSFIFQPGDLTPEEMKRAVKIALDSRWLISGGFLTENNVTGNGTLTVTSHAYSFMFSSHPNSLFVMRNPWGYTPFRDYETSNGTLEITDDGYIPSVIDMVFIHPGAALPYAVDKLKPYYF